MGFSCLERLRLLTEYNEAIVRYYGRPGGRPLKENEREAALTLLKTTLAAYQEHVKNHDCVPQEQERENPPNSRTLEAHEGRITRLERRGRENVRIQNAGDKITCAPCSS